MKDVIDTREQLPYEFEDSITRTLQTGDYSIFGYEDQITVERKTKADAYGTIGKGRTRFIKELERMTELKYSAIVVESSLCNFIKPPRFSQLNPNSAIQSLIAWSIRYNVHVFFADNRIMGNWLTLKILEKFGKEINESIN
jgi:DNA excision repair protein ERCC-4